MKNSQSRMEDMGNSMLIISHRDDDTVEINIDRIDQTVVTFTYSGGESFKTRNALIEVFKAMQKDNQEYFQGHFMGDGQFQERIEDKDNNPNRLLAWYYWDIKIETPFALNPLEFKTQENGGKSPHTHEALIKALQAMQIDNENFPQDRRIAEREPEDKERVERLRRIIEKNRL